MAKINLKLCGKVIVCCVIFIVVLSTGLTSKAAIFFVTSSIGQGLKDISPGRQHRDASENDPIENLGRVACWMWSLFFTFTVPELFVFLRSVHVCLSRRDCWKRPRFLDFAVAFLSETAQAIGLAFLFGSVFPCLSVVHGILITNCVYLMPALFNFLSRKPDEPKRIAKMTMDGFAFLAQLSGCLHWNFIRSDATTLDNNSDTSLVQHQPAIDWMLPVSLILVSLGCWENYVNKDAPVGFIRSLGRIKENLKKSRPFVQIFVSLWKISVFLGTMLMLTGILLPETVTSDANLNSFFFTMKQGLLQFWSGAMSMDWSSPFYIFVIQSITSLLFYWFGTIACRIDAQIYCLVFPVVVMTPVLISTLMLAQFNTVNSFPSHFASGTDDELNHHQLTILLVLFFIWFLSKIWITLHFWKPIVLDSGLSDSKWYNSLLIEQSLSLSSPHCRDQGAITSSCSTCCSVTTRIFAVATMWHETNDEMRSILKSIFRMDKDQSKRRATCYHSKVIDPHLYHFETHIFFDDAYESCSKDGITSRVVNQFVKNFVAMVDEVTSESTNSSSLHLPTVSVTPYGGRLEWILPGETKMSVHLKDKTKIRIKKRWSQVMYTDFIIRYEMANVVDTSNIFLLSLDGDMDFRPKAVHILVDVMNSQRDVGIVCNRSHPTGSAGAMVWYQIFEYAVGFWLLKPSEDLLGSILCASGCFSLIRAKILLDKEIAAKFTALSEKAHHMIQRDQGEDRWLCTLLIKRGYRLAYCASSYAYTHCPETFEEFYNQRRRWVLSLIANTVDVLWNYRQIVKVNPNISWLYIVFQAVLLAMGLLCPGSIFLALVHTSATTFFLNPWVSLAAHSTVIVIFVVTCFIAPTYVQLAMAKTLSALYGLILGAVVVRGLVAMSSNSGIQTSWSIHDVFFLSLTICIFLTGCLYPSEIHCLFAGPVYLLLTPSMSILLMLYSIINMNVVSWGTRDSISSETTRPLRTETFAQETENNFNIRKKHEIVAGSAMASQISIEDGQTFTNADQLPMGVKYSQPSEREHDSPEATVSITSTPGICNKNSYKTKAALGWNLDRELTLSKQLRNVKCLSEEENSYWNDLIDRKLFPVPESSPEHKERISTDLIRLRNLSFTCFFLLNSIFVALMFGMQVNSDISIPQGLNSTSSSSLHTVEELIGANDSWWSQTNPMHIVLVFLAGLMLVIQFTALLISRVDTLTRLLSSVQFTFFRGSPASINNVDESPLSNQIILTDYNPAENEENSTTRHHSNLFEMNAISQF